MNIRSLTLRSAFPTGTFAVAALLLGSDAAPAQRAGQADLGFGECLNGLQIIETDPPFHTNASVAAPDGRIHVAGFAFGSMSLPALLRLERDGRLDLDFGVIHYEVPVTYDGGAFTDVRILPDGSDPSYGDVDSDAFTGVGRSVAIPSQGKAHWYSAVMNGDRLVIVGSQMAANRLVATGFLDDRLLSDGFE